MKNADFFVESKMAQILVDEFAQSIDKDIIEIWKSQLEEKELGSPFRMTNVRIEKCRNTR